MDQIDINDKNISENKENQTETGIVKIGQQKDVRKYASNTEEEILHS